MTETARGVRGVRIHPLPVIPDDRGALMFAEVGAHLPFVPQRVFALYAIAEGKARGDHAHRECHQFVICYGGSCVLTLDDGRIREDVRVD